MVNASRVLDEWLLVSARAGDRRAFEAFARRWQKRLLAHAWRLLGDVDSARDATQEGWVEIVRSLPRLRDERAFPAWAFRIITRRCARYVAANVRRRQLATDYGNGPSHDLVDGSSVGLAPLRKAIRALPEGQRAAIALHHFEELSVAEVAVALDVPVGTVKSRLMHARRKLRDALGGDE